MNSGLPSRSDSPLVLMARIGRRQAAGMSWRESALSLTLTGRLRAKCTCKKNEIVSRLRIQYGLSGWLQCLPTCLLTLPRGPEPRDSTIGATYGSDHNTYYLMCSRSARGAARTRSRSRRGDWPQAPACAPPSPPRIRLYPYVPTGCGVCRHRSGPK